ncbi:MAG: phospholipase D-like domain-containing protein [Pseudomonadota bacterium]
MDHGSLDDPSAVEEAPVATFQPLFTAEEAYPALEALFLAARRHVTASFRIFDLQTRLRSAEARAIGACWFDLICHTIERGVDIDFVLADFDPILAPALHAATWRSAQQFYAAQECSPGPGRLRFTPALHPAVAGRVPRTVYWPLVRRKLRAQLAELNRLLGPERQAALRHRPGLWPLVRTDAEGQLTLAGGAPLLFHPATHHQKLAVFDDATVFLGGQDVDERRYDDRRHSRPAEQTWQDVSCIFTGPAVRFAIDHLARFRSVAEPTPTRSPFLRTMSRPWRRNPFAISPRTVLAEIEAETCRLFARAESLIYIETQFLRSQPIARALAAAGRRNPRLTVIVMLPAAPEDVAFENATGLDARFGEYLQARAVRIVRRAFGQRAFFGMPLKPVAKQSPGRDTAEGAPIVYIHSKLTIVDDRGAIVSSANLNGRSLRWDTEAGIRLDRADQVRDLRQQAFQSWLPADASPACFDPAGAAAAWRALAEANVAVPPHARRSFLAPYQAAKARRFGTPAPFIPEETV